MREIAYMFWLSEVIDAYARGAEEMFELTESGLRPDVSVIVGARDAFAKTIFGTGHPVLPVHRLDLESLKVETFDMGVYAHWGPCTGCGMYDLLDEWDACIDCLYNPGPSDLNMCEHDRHDNG